MSTNTPSAQEVRDQLQPFRLRHLAKLAELSGVPPTTLYKIKRGITESPRIETVRKFMPHIRAALKS
jgi:predicted transcriptional regulator